MSGIVVRNEGRHMPRVHTAGRVGMGECNPGEEG